ncbi:class I SAM-dependent methyltransferase [bacterium]|nr:class I SAM-dependent methyltransferase [bacterium]
MSRLNLVDSYNRTVQQKIGGVLSARLRDPLNSLWWQITEDLLAPFEKKLEHCSSVKILDYGGGCGHKSANIAVSLMKLCKKVHVDYFDLDPIACVLAKTMFDNLGIPNRVVELYDDFMMAEKESYDFVVFSEVYEHFPLDQVSVLTKDISEKIKRGGFLLLTTPNFYGMGRAEDADEYYKRRKLGHYKHYTPEEVTRNLSVFGLKDVACRYSCDKRSKIKLFSKFWYPFFRLDGRLTNSKKIPAILRKLYFLGSHPFFALLDKFLHPFMCSMFRQGYTNPDPKSSRTLHLLFQK